MSYPMSPKPDNYPPPLYCAGMFGHVEAPTVLAVVPLLYYTSPKSCRKWESRLMK